MNIGIELEFTGVDRRQVAMFFKNYFGNMTVSQGKCDEPTCDSTSCSRVYEIYEFEDYAKRIWTLSQDVSVEAKKSVNFDSSNLIDLDEDEMGFDYHYFTNEMQTPVLDTYSYEDLKLLGEVWFILKTCGCISNDSCATHVHIDAPKDHRVLGLYLKNYMKIQYEQYDQFNVAQIKRNKYAKPYIVDLDCKTITKLSDIYDYIENNYLESRYPDGKLDAKHWCINFGAIDEHNTIEFRAFNGTVEFTELVDIIMYVVDFVDRCEKASAEWIKSL